MARFVGQCLSKSGYWPLWNPYVLCGVPQIQVCWPLVYWPQWFLTLPFGLGMAAFLFVHQLFGGCTAYLWQYWRTEQAESGRRSAAVLFGLGFMLCGYMTSSSINPGLLATVCTIPLMFCLLDQLLKQPRLWQIPALGLALGWQINAGRPELIALSLLLYSSYLAIALRHKQGYGCSFRRADFFGLWIIIPALLLAAGCSAINWLPMLELLDFCPKVGSLLTLNANYWSCGWYEFLGIILNYPLGYFHVDAYDSYPTCPGKMPYIGSLYLGAPIVSLSILGFTRNSWGQKFFWLAWLILAAALSSGLLTFLAALTSKLLPDILIFRFPVKLSIFVLLPVLLAAAQGWLAVFAAERRRAMLWVLFWMWSAIGVLAWLLQSLSEVPAGPGSLLGPIMQAGAFQGWKVLPWEMLSAGVAGMSFCLCLLASSKAKVNWKAAVGFLITACLLFFNAANSLWRTVDDSFWQKRSALAQWLRNRDGQGPQGFRVLSLIDESQMAPAAVASLPPELIDSVFMQYDREILLPNTNMDELIQLTNGVSTIPSWLSLFLQTGIFPRLSQFPDLTHPAGKSDYPLYRFCQSASTSFVLTSIFNTGSETKPLAQLDKRWFKLIREDSRLNFRVYEIDQVKPRYYLQDAFVNTGSRQEALTRMNRADTSQFNPDAMLLLTDLQSAMKSTLPKSGGAGIELLPGEQAGEIELVAENHKQTDILLSARVPCFLIVNDSYYPGWKAWDNGTETKIYLANGFFRAIYLQPGKHQITFAYQAQALFWGEIISKLALVLLAILFSLALALYVVQIYSRRLAGQQEKAALD